MCVTTGAAVIPTSIFVKLKCQKSLAKMATSPFFYYYFIFFFWLDSDRERERVSNARQYNESRRSYGLLCVRSFVKSPRTKSQRDFFFFFLFCFIIIVSKLFCTHTNRRTPLRHMRGLIIFNGWPSLGSKKCFSFPFPLRVCVCVCVCTWKIRNFAQTVRMTMPVAIWHFCQVGCSDKTSR